MMRHMTITKCVTLELWKFYEKNLVSGIPENKLDNERIT